MRPHSSRPLQYEDGVGGSQRRAASSGTNTGNRRAGKCRHGKTETPGHLYLCFYPCGLEVVAAERAEKRGAHLIPHRLAKSNSGGQREPRDNVWRKTRGSSWFFEVINNPESPSPACKAQTGECVFVIFAHYSDFFSVFAFFSFTPAALNVHPRSCNVSLRLIGGEIDMVTQVVAHTQYSKRELIRRDLERACLAAAPESNLKIEALSRLVVALLSAKGENNSCHIFLNLCSSVIHSARLFFL